jgi:threonine dehydrogenase-like Zn-dependent dehydrogenase
VVGALADLVGDAPEPLEVDVAFAQLGSQLTHELLEPAGDLLGRFLQCGHPGPLPWSVAASSSRRPGAETTYDRRVRAVVVDETGEPRLADVAEPAATAETVRVLACGLCGSDLEKLRPEEVGRVLGHEVVAETHDGRRVALVHHDGCGECERCLGGHESTCDVFAGATIRPGGFAERVAAAGWVELPEGVDVARGTAVEPLACVLRAEPRVPQGRILVIGHGFVGHLFAAVLRRRGDEVFAVDARPERSGAAPDGEVDAVVLAAPGGAEAAAAGVKPGGTILVFADAGSVPAAPIYRRELTIVGSRSATPETMREAAALLPDLDVPEPTVLPLERFAEGLELHRSGRALKVVFTP